MSATEIAAGTWRLESLFGARFLYQYVVADGDEAMIVDTGDATTPRDVIMPGLRSLGIAPGQVTLVLVTHPDLDHQGGLAGLREQLPHAIAACGFADRMMVSEPERLVTDRYGAYQAEHDSATAPPASCGCAPTTARPPRSRSAWPAARRSRSATAGWWCTTRPGTSPGHLDRSRAGDRPAADARTPCTGSMCPAADGSPALPPPTRTSTPTWRRST